MSFKYLTKFPVKPHLYDSRLHASISSVVGLKLPSSHSQPRNLTSPTFSRSFGILERHQSPIKPTRTFAVAADNKKQKCPVPMKCDAIEDKNGCVRFVCAPYDFVKKKKKVTASCKPTKDTNKVTAECKLNCSKMGLNCCCIIKYKPEDLIKIHKAGKSVKATGYIEWEDPEMKDCKQPKLKECKQSKPKQCKPPKGKECKEPKPEQCDKPFPPQQIPPEPPCEGFILDPDACDLKRATSKCSPSSSSSWFSAKEKKIDNARLFCKDASSDYTKGKHLKSDKCKIKVSKKAENESASVKLKSAKGFFKKNSTKCLASKKSNETAVSKSSKSSAFLKNCTSKCKISPSKNQADASISKDCDPSLLPTKCDEARKTAEKPIITDGTKETQKPEISRSVLTMTQLTVLFPIKETKVWSCNPDEFVSNPSKCSTPPSDKITSASDKKHSKTFAPQNKTMKNTGDCDLQQFQFKISDITENNEDAEGKCIEINFPLLKEYFSKVKKNVCPKVCKSVLDKKWSELGLTKQNLAKTIATKAAAKPKESPAKESKVESKTSVSLAKVKEAPATKLDTSKLSVKAEVKSHSKPDEIKSKQAEKKSSWSSLIKSSPTPSSEPKKEEIKTEPISKVEKPVVVKQKSWMDSLKGPQSVEPPKEVAAKTATAVSSKAAKTDLESFCDQINSMKNKVDYNKDAVVDVDCLIDEKDSCQSKCQLKSPCEDTLNSCENQTTICAEKQDICEESICKDKTDICENSSDICADKRDIYEDKRAMCCDQQDVCKESKSICENKNVCEDKQDDKNVICETENVCASSEAKDPCCESVSTDSTRINNDPCNKELCIFKGKEKDDLCEEKVVDKCNESKCSSSEMKCKESNESKKGPPKSGGCCASVENAPYSCPSSKTNTPQVLFKNSNLENKFQVEALLIPHSLEVYSISKTVELFPKKIDSPYKSVADNVRRYSRHYDSHEQFLPRMDRVSIRFQKESENNTPFYYQIINALKEYFGFKYNPDLDLNLLGPPTKVIPKRIEHVPASVMFCKKCCKLPTEEKEEEKVYDRCNKCAKYEKPKKKKKKIDCCNTNIGVDSWLESRKPTKQSTQPGRCGCYELCWEPHKGKCGMEECPRCRRYAVYEDPVAKPKPIKCAEVAKTIKMAPVNCCKPRKLNRSKLCEYPKKLEEGTCKKKKKKLEVEKSPCGGPCLKTKCVLEKKKPPCDPNKPFCQEGNSPSLMKPEFHNEEKYTCKSTVKVSSARPFNSTRECEPPRVAEIPPEEPIIEVKGCQRSDQCKGTGIDYEGGSTNVPFPRLDAKLPKPPPKCKKGFLEECKCFCETMMNVFTPSESRPKRSPSSHYYTPPKPVTKEVVVKKSREAICKQPICKPPAVKLEYQIEPPQRQIAKPLILERPKGHKCKKDTEILRGRVTKDTKLRRNYLEMIKHQKKPLGRRFPTNFKDALEPKYQCKRIPGPGDKFVKKHEKKWAGYLRPLNKSKSKSRVDKKDESCGCSRTVICKKKRN